MIRHVGPTAASKIMFALRPDTVAPWDATIAQRTTGGTKSQHFAQHLTTARLWATSTLDEAARAGVAHIPTHVGRPNSSLAKIYDEWQYLTITRNAPAPPPTATTQRTPTITSTPLTPRHVRDRPS